MTSNNRKPAAIQAAEKNMAKARKTVERLANKMNAASQRKSQQLKQGITKKKKGVSWFTSEPFTVTDSNVYKTDEQWAQETEHLKTALVPGQLYYNKTIVTATVKDPRIPAEEVKFHKPQQLGNSASAMRAILAMIPSWDSFRTLPPGSTITVLENDTENKVVKLLATAHPDYTTEDEKNAASSLYKGFMDRVPLEPTIVFYSYKTAIINLEVLTEETEKDAKTVHENYAKLLRGSYTVPMPQVVTAPVTQQPKKINLPGWSLGVSKHSAPQVTVDSSDNTKVNVKVTVQLPGAAKYIAVDKMIKDV